MSSCRTPLSSVIISISSGFRFEVSVAKTADSLDKTSASNGVIVLEMVTASVASSVTFLLFALSREFGCLLFPFVEPRLV